MAIDDAQLTMTASVAGGGTADIQPSSGDEWLLHRIGLGQSSGGSAPYIVPDVAFDIYDGTNSAGVTRLGTSTATEDSASLQLVPYHIHITNSVYVRAYNNNGSAGAACFSATETK